MANENYPLIMIVEDDLDLRSIYKQLLEHSGFPVVDFADGQTALATVQEGQIMPRLILLDYMLPGMNGDEFLKQLSALPNLQKIPVILISALVGETPEIANLKSHPWVTAFFTKTDITNAKLIDFVKAEFGLE
jgi:two-component system, OmpR family, phosphate regulon response regulator PhoB